MMIMDRAYFLKVALFYLTLVGLITLNRFFGGAISGEFQSFANVVLLLIGAGSIFLLLIRQLKASRPKDGNASVIAKADLFKEIAKKIMK